MTRPAKFYDDLRVAVQSWSALTMADFCMAALAEYPGLTMLEIEKSIRESQSRTTFLIAKLPTHLPTGPLHLKIFRPDSAQDKFVPAKTWVWICTDGPDDWLKELAKTKVTAKENEENLKDCGFPFAHEPPAGTLKESLINMRRGILRASGDGETQMVMDGFSADPSWK